MMSKEEKQKLKAGQTIKFLVKNYLTKKVKTLNMTYYNAAPKSKNFEEWVRRVAARGELDKYNNLS